MQWSPNFLTPGTDFMEDNFSTDQGEGDGGMIQVHSIYCALSLEFSRQEYWSG